MFIWINKQPGIQKIWNGCSHYKDIYHYWISPVNKSSDLWFILSQQSMGGNECGKSGRLHIFTYLKHLLMLFKCKFFRASFLHFSKTLIECRVMQLRCFKVEILLNNALKGTDMYSKVNLLQRQFLKTILNHHSTLKFWAAWPYKSCMLSVFVVRCTKYEALKSHY